MFLLRHLEKSCLRRASICCRASSLSTVLYSAKISNCLRQPSQRASLLLPAQSRFFLSAPQSGPDKIVHPDYVKLYLLNMFNIRVFRLICRLSKFSCLMFLLGAPVCVLSSLSNLMPWESSKSIIAILAFYSVFFTGQSFLLTSRTLAKLMIRNDGKMLKISHLSIFGDKTDIFVEPSKIIPFKDVESEVFEKRMVVVKLKDSNLKGLLFFPNKGGDGTNFEVLELILSGSLNKEIEE